MNRARTFHALGRVAGWATLIGCMAIAGATIFKWHQLEWARCMKFTLCALVLCDIHNAVATFCAPESWLSRLLNMRFLKLAGKYSDAIHWGANDSSFWRLQNMLLQRYQSALLGDQCCYSESAAFAATFAIAQVSWCCFERPFIDVEAFAY